MKGGAIKRGYLGVGIQPVTDDIAVALGLPKDRGELIAARRAGRGRRRRPGSERATSSSKVNGQDVTPDQTLSLPRRQRAARARSVPLEVIRDGKPQTVTADGRHAPVRGAAGAH